MEKPDVLSEKEIPVRFISQANYEMIDHRLSRLELFRIAKDEGLLEAQRDADVAWHNKWYGELLAEFKQIKVERAELLDQIKQAKTEVAREIENFLQLHLYARPDKPTATMKFTDWQKLRKLLSKYLKEAA